MTVLALVASVAALSAQAPVDQPRFEVASVKPNGSSNTGGFTRLPAQGQITLTNIPLRSVIARAYGTDSTLERFTLAGGPEDILSMRFDISAKPPEGAAPGAMPAMLQTLLVDRFKLRPRREVRQVPVYTFTTARRDGRLGPELRPSEYDCSALYAARRSAQAPDPPRDPKGRGLC